MKYPVVVHKSDYGYDAHCPILPGCHSQGDTVEETLENIKDAIITYLEMIAEETKGSIYEVEVTV
ncbi:MAG: type II toxin-antitoxin system HicB family antitoxin [Planctomycetes bacterium]|uniref:type II toxin-antitoxin system HicB family antitoxin n=1 Tax=Candidatus Wunengus californicus TaxID=3367619 RepID=UPI004026D5F1|nr:type II toxin-antitoxin system HicB family antitoxin [Planctomycetota bacterium]MBI4221109.1 type II toxin-antitoxin system HicB family antitoxin [Planctomycetota bacterium]